jgi:hypothetical protein
MVCEPARDLSRSSRRALRNFETSATSFSGLGHAHLRFRSGVILDTEAGYLSRFRDALAVWARMYPSHAAALEAAGLRE